MPSHEPLLVEEVIEKKFPHYTEVRLVLKSAALLGVEKDSDAVADHLREVVGLEKLQSWCASANDDEAFEEEAQQQPIDWRVLLKNWLAAAAAFEKSLAERPDDELADLLEIVGNKSRVFASASPSQPPRKVVAITRRADSDKPAKFEYWLSKPAWTTDEAAFLSMGVEPRRDGGKHPIWPRHRDFLNRRDLLDRALAAGDFKKPTPKAILAWARTRKDFEWPAELISPPNGPVIDNKPLAGMERKALYKFIVYLVITQFPDFDPHFSRTKTVRTDAFTKIAQAMAERKIIVNRKTLEKHVVAALDSFPANFFAKAAGKNTPSKEQAI